MRKEYIITDKSLRIGAVLKFNLNEEIPENVQVERKTLTPHKDFEYN
jgi:hypothetical protein